MLRLTTLGAIDLRDRHGHPIRAVLSQPKRVALLVYLVVEGAKGPVSRDRVLGLFWPESDEAHARNALSQALHALRQGLGAEVIESQGATTVELHADQLWCDATAFVEAIERGEPELALDLYRGEWCPTLFLSGNPEVEQWMDAHRGQLRRMALGSARAHAERQADHGDLAGGARTARRAMAMHPDDEADVRALLGVLDRSGDTVGALYAYDEYARRLAAELETTPAPETRALVDAMRRRREAAVAGSPAPAPEPLPAAAGRPPGPGPSGLRWVFSAAAVVALVVLAGVLGLRARATPTPAPGNRVAVLPFVLHGAAANAYLGEGMVDLLSAKLDGASGLHTIDPRSVVAAAARDSGGALDQPASAGVARRLGAGWYVSGELVEIAGRLQLSASLYQTGASLPAARASVSGDASAVFELVDDLAGRILARFARGRDTTLTRLAALTTHSLPALKAFLNGEQAMRAGRDAEAAAAFVEAVTLDSTFALAQYRLALASTWVSVPGVGIPEAIARKAAVVARNAARLSPLVRDLLTAYSAYKDLKGAEAERLYLAIARAHPDNVEGWFMLGETHFHYNQWRGRSPGEARPSFERVLALDPSNSHALIHLGRLAAIEGRPAELDSLARRYSARYQGAERNIEIQALQSFVSGDSAQWAQVAASLRRGDALVGLSTFQAATTYAQNLDAARVLVPAIAPLASDPLTRQLIPRFVSEIALAEGRWDPEPLPVRLGSVSDNDWLLEARALVASEPIFAVDASRMRTLRDTLAARRSFPAHSRGQIVTHPGMGGIMRDYLVGLLSIRLGDTARAAGVAGALAGVRSNDLAQPALEASHALAAEIARSRGDAAGALAELDHFEFAVSTAGNWAFVHWGVRERFLKAELLHALRRDDEALQWYNSFPSGYDVPFMAVAHFRQGQIYHGRGNHERARFHFGRFISLWKNADAQYRPMLDEARRAIGGD